MSWILGVIVAIAVIAVVVGLMQRLVKVAVTALIVVFLCLLGYYLILDNAPPQVAQGVENVAGKAANVGGVLTKELGEAGSKAVKKIGEAAKPVAADVGEAAKKAGEKMATEAAGAAKKAGEKVAAEAAEAAKRAGEKAVEGAKDALKKPAGE